MLCALLGLSWSVSAQGTRQSVDGVITQRDGGTNTFRQMEWDPAEEVLLVASGGGAYMLDYNFNLVQQITQGEQTWSVSWNPSGTEFLVTTRTGYQVWTWDGQIATLTRETVVANEVVAAYWSSLGSKIATVERLPGEFSITVQIVIRSAVTGEVLQTSIDYFGIPTESAIADQWDWSPTDDRYLYGVGYTVEIRADGLPYLSRDPMIYRLDTETGSVERVTTLGSGLFYSIDLDPTGTYLVATDNSVTQIWSLIIDQRITYFPGPTMGLSWRRDGKFLMAGAGLIDITRMERLGGFEFGPSIVRMNSRYNRVASAWDTSLLLQDLTAFDAYEPITPATVVPTLTPTPEPTATLTPSPTPTPTPPPSPTPTPAAFQRLRLTAMCSAAPGTYRVWRVRNSNAYDVAVTWDVYRSPAGQTGLVIAPAARNGVPGEVIFVTNTEPGPNTTRIFANGTQQDVKASTTAGC
jgi:WD40 repeat protein